MGVPSPVGGLVPGGAFSWGVWSQGGVGGPSPYIGCGLSTNKLGLLQELGQRTTFVDMKGCLPFPVNSAFEYH